MPERVQMTFGEDGYIHINTTSTITSCDAQNIRILENPQHPDLGAVGKKLASDLLPYADLLDFLTVGPMQLTVRLEHAVRDTEKGQETIQNIYRKVREADTRAMKPAKVSRFDKNY